MTKRGKWEFHTSHTYATKNLICSVILNKKSTKVHNLPPVTKYTDNRTNRKKNLMFHLCTHMESTANVKEKLLTNTDSQTERINSVIVIEQKKKKKSIPLIDDRHRHAEFKATSLKFISVFVNRYRGWNQSLSVCFPVTKTLLCHIVVDGYWHCHLLVTLLPSKMAIWPGGVTDATCVNSLSSLSPTGS